MRAVAIICARGGSKGVPRKNIKKLNGFPLIVYSIKTARESKLIDRIIVSTDDKEIARIAKMYGAEVPFIRPAELAGDNVATAPVVEHAVKFLRKHEYNPDIIVLLDVTSPMRTVHDIDNCIKAVMTNKDIDASFTVCETHGNPYFNMVEQKKGKYFGLVCQLKERPTCRQLAPKVYWVNSAVWVVRTKRFMKTLSFFPQRTVCTLMPESRSYHIDSELDFELMEFIMKKEAERNERFI